MIRCIEALHYRSLRYVNQSLSGFQILVGRPKLETLLDWADHSPEESLGAFLVRKNFCENEGEMPKHPKEALRAALRRVRKPYSSSFYNQLAEKAGMKRCVDPSFQKLKSRLQTWFPPQDGPTS